MIPPSVSQEEEMNMRGWLTAAVIGGIALVSSPTLAQEDPGAEEPAPWETGVPPEEDTAAPAPAPAQQPAAAPADGGSAMLGDMDPAALPPVGKVGIGYFTTSAPIGVRMWLTEKIGFDAGLGFSIDSTPEDVAWGTSIEGGILYALATTQNLIVFARGGLGVGLGQSGVPDADVNYNIVLNGLLGGEFFMTALGFPNLSFTAGIGLQMDFTDGPDGDFGIRIATASAPVNLVASAVLGFHIYL
jgi:hypothetical protein